MSKIIITFDAPEISGIGDIRRIIWMYPGTPSSVPGPPSTGISFVPGPPGIDGDEPESFPIPGPSGPASSIPGPPGIDGKDCITMLISLDGNDGEDAFPIPGQKGEKGEKGDPGGGSGGNSIPGLDGQDGDDSFPLFISGGGTSPPVIYNKIYSEVFNIDGTWKLAVKDGDTVNLTMHVTHTIPNTQDDPSPVIYTGVEFVIQLRMLSATVFEQPCPVNNYPGMVMEWTPDCSQLHIQGDGPDPGCTEGVILRSMDSNMNNLQGPMLDMMYRIVQDPYDPDDAGTYTDVLQIPAQWGRPGASAWYGTSLSCHINDDGALDCPRNSFANGTSGTTFGPGSGNIHTIGGGGFDSFTSGRSFSGTITGTATGTVGNNVSVNCNDFLGVAADNVSITCHNFSGVTFNSIDSPGDNYSNCLVQADQTRVGSLTNCVILPGTAVPDGDYDRTILGNGMTLSGVNDNGPAALTFANNSNGVILRDRMVQEDPDGGLLTLRGTLLPNSTVNPRGSLKEITAVTPHPNCKEAWAGIERFMGNVTGGQDHNFGTLALENSIPGEGWITGFAVTNPLRSNSVIFADCRGAVVTPTGDNVTGIFRASFGFNNMPLIGVATDGYCPGVNSGVMGVAAPGMEGSACHGTYSYLGVSVPAYLDQAASVMNNGDHPDLPISVWRQGTGTPGQSTIVGGVDADGAVSLQTAAEPQTPDAGIKLFRRESGTTPNRLVEFCAKASDGTIIPIFSTLI